ncbi:LysR family transcriptional regulator [Ferrovibrio sp.]|uniref:LysR family transcriptional regulator n=1 Tax=Ferrovibrio sp. TaxID=1917215 RepID=UPI00260319C1|nr:LysR family transcriptional regulator [Ferrovibrio sp.]
MDHLADLAVFARVVETGGFSAAATTLRLSKSAVSKQIARLEQRLGAQLLQRTTRRLSLTETGRIVLEHAQRVLIEAEAAEAAVQNLQAMPRGLLRVNLPMSFGLAYVSPLLPDLLALYPELRIDLTFNDRLIDLMEEEVDVAIRIGHLADSSLTARRLAPVRPITCASESYLRKAGVPLKPEDLRQHECLLYKYLPEPDIWRYEGPGGPWAVKVGGRLQANNGDVLRAAAVAGHGIVRSPSFIAGPDIAAGRLVPLLEAYEPAPLGIYAVYPAQRFLTPKVRAFIDFLAERFGPRPPWECVLADTAKPADRGTA